jgi:hypothetical protein
VTLSAGQVYETKISSGRNVEFRCPPDPSEGITVIVNFESGVIGYRPDVRPDTKLGPGDITPGLPPDLSPDELAQVLKFLPASGTSTAKPTQVAASGSGLDSKLAQATSDPTPQPTTNEPTPQPAAIEPAPQPAASEPAPQPAASEPAPQPAASKPAPALELDQLNKVGSLYSHKDLGPVGTFAAAKSHCAKLDQAQAFGLSGWRMATSSEIAAFKAKNLLYWTKEVDGSKAKTFSTFGGDPWREQTDAHPRAFCVSK